MRMRKGRLFVANKRSIAMEWVMGKFIDVGQQ